MTAPTRAVPFAERLAGREFNTKFTTLVGELLRQSAASRIPPENTQTFYHGRSWKQKNSSGEEISGQVKAHNATTTLRFDTVVEGQLDAIASQARSIVEQMQSHFMRTLYETVSNAVEAVGNVVDARNKPTPEAFLEMLRKIEFAALQTGGRCAGETKASRQKAPASTRWRRRSRRRTRSSRSSPRSTSL